MCDEQTDGQAIAYRALNTICCRALKTEKVENGEGRDVRRQTAGTYRLERECTVHLFI